MTLTYDRKTGGLAFDTKTIRMLNEKKSSGETTNSDQIQVIKKQYEGNSSIFIPGGAVYYMALFLFSVDRASVLQAAATQKQEE